MNVELLTLLRTAVLTALLLSVFAPTASFLRLLDEPDNKRKLHSGNVPLTGGISLYLSLVVVFYISGLATASLTNNENFWLITMAMLAILVMLHAVDDVVELRAETRLAIDALLAFLICSEALVKLTTLGDLFGMGEVTLGRYSVVMTIFCFVAASNAFNMVDGIDSLCSGLGFVALGTLLALISIGGAPGGDQLAGAIMVVMVALVVTYAANLGALGKPLRVFLGDSGARLIAFIVAITLIVAAQKRLIHPVMAYFTIAVPVCDCLVLMGVRAFKGRSPISGDRLHLHHLLQDIGFSAPQARRAILSLAVAVAACGVLFQVSDAPDWVVSVFVVGSFWMYIALRLWLARPASRRTIRRLWLWLAILARKNPRASSWGHPLKRWQSGR